MIAGLDARIAPPVPPPQTHREERLRLPVFPVDARPRLERGRAYLAETRAHIDRIHRAGASGLSVCRLFAEMTDRLVIGLWNELVAEQQPPSGIALAALGGYGRRETAPHSDVDLILLRSPKASEERVRPFAQAFNTLLWDLKLVVGWSVRTPAESSRAAEEDHTVRTALLDCRYLAGDETIYSTLPRSVLRELLSHRADRFISDKIAELNARREKHGDTVYLLEPHVKLGRGGLRDLEGALWIAQARYRTRGLRQLLHEAVLPASEVNLLTAARDFLMRVRNHLHSVRKRKEDRLTFDLQEEVAGFLGYQPSDAGLPVEQFMRHYYLAAKVVRNAADALIVRCEESRTVRGPAIERRMGPFKVFRGKLTLDGGPEVLRDAPANVLRLFRVAEEEDLPVYSWARDQAQALVPALAEAKAEPAVVNELVQFLTRPGTRGDRLLEIHDLGVLGAVLPEFGRVTALHQHDLYHVYTVDIHSLVALRRLYALRNGDLLEREPELSRWMRELSDPLPLYLGMLFHDAGKGMGGDHSEKGRQLVAQVGERLGLVARSREIAEFLVLKHLLMSRTSQRRDLSDPDLIASFAAECGDVEKLTCLYLLTYADMCSVAPTMWNEWKARLLKELFDKARDHLLGATGAQAATLARSRFIAAWDRALGLGQGEALARRLPERYFASTPPDDAVLHARMLSHARQRPLVCFLRQRSAVGLSEISLAAADRPGLLALFAGVFSAHRIDILQARIASTDDGYALDVFQVRGPFGQLERSRWRAARADLHRALAGKLSIDELLRKRRPSEVLSTKQPSVETLVSIDPTGSQRYTVIDVRAQDRVGFLYAVTSQLHAAGLEIAIAVVATEGNRAMDSFYLTRAGKRLDDAAGAALALELQAAVDAFVRQAR